MTNISSIGRIIAIHITLLIIMLALQLPLIVIVHAQAPSVPRDQTLIFSDFWGDNNVLNPYLPTGVPGYLEAVYMKLFIYSGIMDKWLPWLAEGYRWVDRYTLDVRLRPQAKWSDGVPVTASDVEYTFKLGKRYNIPALSQYWLYFEDIISVDDHTVRFVLNKSNTNYFMLMQALYSVSILPKHRWEKLETQYGDKLWKEFKDDPRDIIGDGPYKIIYSTPDIIIFQRDDNWWGKDIFGLPAPKYLIHQKPRSNDEIMLRYQAGNIDLGTHGLWGLEKLWLEQGLRRGTYLKSPPYFMTWGFHAAALNYKNEILSIPAVRLAIFYAFPYEDVVQKAYQNYIRPPMAVPGNPIYPQLNQLYNWSIVDKILGTRELKTDLEKAKKILDDAGIIDRDGDGIRELPNGKKLSVSVMGVYGSGPQFVADLLVQNLKKIGFDAKIELPDSSTWAARVANLQYDIAVGVVGPGPAAPQYYYWNLFRFLMDPRLKYPQGNPSGFNPPSPLRDELTSILDEMPSTVYNSTRFRELADRLLEIYLTYLPVIAYTQHALWYEYSEDYWIGFPNEDRPYTQGWWFGVMYTGNGNWLLTLFYIVSRSDYEKGVKPTIPMWMLELPFTTDKFLNDLAKVALMPSTTTSPASTTSSATTITVTTAITMTQTSVLTVPTTSITTATITVTDYTMTGVAAIVTLIVGLAIGWIIFRRR